MLLTLHLTAAFCFYNLSSIVNGLVYFDQFSLISPLHLGLVVVGIVVLLAGVWVVSIQAGSGGVDVDRWQEGEQPLSDDVAYISDVPEADAEQGVHEAGQSESLLARGRVPLTVSNSHIPSSPIPRRQSLRIQTPILEDRVPLPVTSSSPPYSPPGRRRTIPPDTSLLLSPTRSSFRRRRQTATMQPTDTQVSLSPPLGGGSVLGAGLSIGLGPMSPGFSIVPRDRRRRVSGLGLPDGVEYSGGQRRRTVSEGDLRQETNGSEQGGGISSGGDGDGDGGEANEGGDGLPVVENAGKKESRWKWVRRIFLDRR
jgi:hypothetical protein